MIKAVIGFGMGKAMVNELRKKKKYRNRYKKKKK